MGRPCSHLDELAAKMNWHHLSVTFDPDRMRFDTINCNDIVMDASGFAPFEIKAMPYLDNAWWISTLPGLMIAVAVIAI